MALNLEAFTARLNEICIDMEAGMLAAKRQFDYRLGILVDVAAGGQEDLSPEFKAAAEARLGEMERRLIEAGAK